MTASRLVALVALGLVAMSNSCKKEDVLPCNAAADVITAQVAGLVAHIAEPVPNVGQTNEYVINSAAGYQALFSGPKLPPIDFITHTLLAGKTRTAGGSYALAQQVTQTCTGYTYTVKLAAGACATASSATYYVLVPKLPAGARVAFDVRLPDEAVGK